MKRNSLLLVAPAMLALLLPACAGQKPRPAAPVAESPRGAARPSPPRDARNDFARACAPTRVHDERDYTPGGLYAPGVSDAGPTQPIDVSGVPEQVPRAEPRSRYGNRSPYKVLGKTYRVLDDEEARRYRERGLASWYGTMFNGRATSSGESDDICQFTAAHKTLPLPSYVRVTNLDNGRSLVVRVNDRGPFHDGRVMDLSYAAAVRLGVDRAGTARVQLEAVGPGDAPAPPGETVIAAAEPRIPAQLAPPAAAWAAPDGSGAQPEAVTLQVSSFRSADNAEALVARLRRAGIGPIDLQRVELAAGSAWRVRVGPVATEDLPAVRERLRALELPEPRVVRD
jgi:rare lipoprotein A